jgi:flagellar biosynthetic protein FliR
MLDLTPWLNLVPTFVLAFFRLGAMFLSAPIFGSARVPRRFKVLFALVTTMAMTPSIKATPLPPTPWEIALGIGGEILFGLAMGTAISFIFVAVNWAGEIIGQQMGMNLGEVFDPQFGQQGSLVGDMYFLLTLVIFLIVRGHHAMLRGVQESFATLPLLTVGINPNLLDLLLGLLTSATTLALQLAAPMLVTVLVVDLVLGFLGKTVPQLNVMAAGLSMRAAVGILVVMVGLAITSDVIRDSMLESIRALATAWR